MQLHAFLVKEVVRRDEHFKYLLSVLNCLAVGTACVAGIMTYFAHSGNVTIKTLANCRSQ
ncbi:MAG: hypothetical protein NVS4B7_07980 [Ktedonobacteraceae bacterium]